MYPDMRYTESESTTAETLILGVAPNPKTIMYCEGSENGGCKCGASCTCDPCTCK